MVTAPLFTLGSAGVSLYSVSPTAMAWARGAAARPQLVDGPLELLLPQPAAMSAMSGASARTGTPVRNRSVAISAAGRATPGPAGAAGRTPARRRLRRCARRGARAGDRDGPLHTETSVAVDRAVEGVGLAGHQIDSDRGRVSRRDVRAPHVLAAGASALDLERVGDLALVHRQDRVLAALLEAEIGGRELELRLAHPDRAGSG